MKRSGWDLVWGTALLLVAAGLVVQLALSDAAGFQVAARVLRLVLVLALAAMFLTTRDLAALAVGGAAVALLLIVATVGMLVAPDQFVGTGPKAAKTADQARALGVLLSVGLVVVSALVLRRWWRWRGSGGQTLEDGPHGG